MKNKGGKKGVKILILLLILVIPILITLFVLQQNLEPDLKKGSVTSLTLVHGEEKDEVEDEEDLEFFIAMAQCGEAIQETTRPLSEYRKCEAIFHKLNREVTYVFYLSDSVHNCVYTDPEGALFLIPEEEAAKLLAHPLIGGFAVSYASYPTLTFAQSGGEYGAGKTEGKWVYSKANETQSSENIKEETESVVILPHGEALNFTFSIQPDFCSITLQNEKGEILYSGDPGEMEMITMETDTPLTLVAECDWYEDNHEEYYGSLTYSFDIFYDVPTECSLDRTTAAPGELITLTVQHSSSETIAVSTTFSSEKIQQLKNDGIWSILIPVSATAVPGEYSIMVMGSDVEETFSVTIATAG